MTRFWHRRICEAIMLVSGLILGLYLWVFLSGTAPDNDVLLVPEAAAVAAGLAFVTALVSHFWSPRKYLAGSALVSYLLLIAMVAILIIGTGDTASPFIALWMLGAVFSPVFGWYGIAIITALTLGFVAWAADSAGLSTETGVTIALLSLVPVAVGLLGLRAGPDTDTDEDRSYRELATELSDVANKSDAVISAIADGVIAVDRRGIIQLINPAAQKLLGWGRKDALGLDYKSVLKITDERDQPPSESDNPIYQAMNNNQPTHTDRYSLSTAESGKKFLASINTSPIGSMGSGAIIIFRDVTNEKKEEREQAEFISTASHEMRTPVASMEGYLGLALNPTIAQVDDKAREYITKAQESAQHLGRLFQDLLDVSKADDGRLKSDPKVVDVVPLMRDIVRGLLPKASEKQLKVNYKPMPDLDPTNDGVSERGDKVLSPMLYVNVDNDHLREVLSNLVENAIKYTISGSINVDVVGSDEHVTISITDSGIGIPKEDIGHLFQKFYRVDNTETREIGGTGLGLYLSRKLTESMGGIIWVESTYKQGSTFNVRLPRIDHIEARRLAQEIDREIPATPITNVTSQPLPVDNPVPGDQQLKPAPEQEVPTLSHSPSDLRPDSEQPLSVSASDSAPQPEASRPLQQAPLTPGDVPRPTLDALAPASPNAAPVFRHDLPNTSLSDIERDPQRYIRPSAVIPPNRTPPDNGR